MKKWYPMSNSRAVTTFFHAQSRKELNLVATVFDVVGMEDGIQERSSHDVIARPHLDRRLLRLHQDGDCCWIGILGSYLCPSANIRDSLWDQTKSVLRGKDS